MIDIYMIMDKEKVSPKMEYAHLSFDCFPLSQTKINAINDLFEEKSQRLEFLFDFSLYHNRWEELKKEDFIKNYTVEKGAESKIGVSETRNFSLIERSIYNNDDSEGKEYLCKMIEECKNLGIEVLLVNMPYPATNSAQKDANVVDGIAQKYNVDYLNFLYETDCVNYITDFYDSDSHLNMSGAKKVSKKLGKYLVDNYKIEDRRNDNTYCDWHEDYKNYISYKEELISNQSSLYNLLMLLYDEEKQGFVYVKAGSDILKDELFAQLLYNIDVGIKVEEALQKRKDYIAIFGSDLRIEILEPQLCETDFGNINIVRDDEKIYVTLNDEVLAEMELDDKVCVSVLDADADVISVICE